MFKLEMIQAKRTAFVEKQAEKIAAEIETALMKAVETDVFSVVVPFELEHNNVDKVKQDIFDLVDQKMIKLYTSKNGDKTGYVGSNSICSNAYSSNCVANCAIERCIV